MSAITRDRTTAGIHLWGRYSVHPVSRSMWSSRTLVVFPPGTSTRERALLRAWHGWTILGALLAVGIMAATNPTPAVGMVAALATYACGFLVLGRATRTLRPRVRSITVTTFYGNGRPEVHGDARLLDGSLDALAVLERALRAQQIRPVDFEMVWADVWNALPPRTHRP